MSWNDACPECGSQDGKLHIGLQKTTRMAYYFWDCRPCKKAYISGMVMGPAKGLEEEYKMLLAHKWN